MTRLEHWQVAARLTEQGTAFAVVTLAGLKGHVPQDLGAKAIITSGGLVSGTIGGGKVEAKAIEQARAMLSDRSRQVELVEWNLTRDVGMTCGGVVSLLFEVHDVRRWEIALFGAGHVAQELARTLERLDCHLTCIDSRAEWLEKYPDSPRLRRVLAPDPVACVSDFSEDAFFIVMTKGHATDLPVLEKIFHTFPDAPYIGVMGSDVKSLKLRKDLIALGVSATLVDRLRSPIGLPIGGNTPAEIAISVVAELLQVRDRLT